MDKFIGGRNSFPLHEIGSATAVGGGGYYLGMFLGWRLHNLFGGSSVVRVSQSDGPYYFAVKRAVLGPSCADVHRAMQQEPEIMFDLLKWRAEEYTGGQWEEVACGLARAFHSIPYLIGAEEGSDTDVMCSGSETGDSCSGGDGDDSEDDDEE